MTRKAWDETLTALAVIYLAAFSYPAFVDPVPQDLHNVLEAIQ
jgi:hypothetical protein